MPWFSACLFYLIMSESRKAARCIDSNSLMELYADLFLEDEEAVEHILRHCGVFLDASRTDFGPNDSFLLAYRCFHLLVRAPTVKWLYCSLRFFFKTSSRVISRLYNDLLLVNAIVVVLGGLMFSLFTHPVTYNLMRILLFALYALYINLQINWFRFKQIVYPSAAFLSIALFFYALGVDAAQILPNASSFLTSRKIYKSTSLVCRGCSTFCASWYKTFCGFFCYDIPRGSVI